MMLKSSEECIVILSKGFFLSADLVKRIIRHYSQIKCPRKSVLYMCYCVFLQNSF